MYIRSINYYVYMQKMSLYDRQTMQFKETFKKKKKL